MKLGAFALLSMLTVLTHGEPVLAQDSTSRLQLEDSRAESVSTLNPRINPQFGSASFEQTHATGSAKGAAFGVTTELGQVPSRRLETGLMVLPMGSARATSTYLTIPMAAKLRIFSMGVQSWFAKFGMAPAFELSSSDKRATNNVDVLMSAGVGGRLALTSKLAFLLEGTFNRGLMDNLRGGRSEYNQGFLVLGGLSIAL